MSQTFFSKQDPSEKSSRLSQLGFSKGQITVWPKGKKEKQTLPILKFDKDRSELVLDVKDSLFTTGSTLLCTFEVRGMNFFSQVVFLKSIAGHAVLHFNTDLFKSERRSSYRLLTFPIYEVWSEFDLGEVYEGGKVVNIRNRTNQTALFKNFLKLVEKKESDEPEDNNLKIRVQDLSTTGMALHIGELENPYFKKDQVFKKVIIHFQDEKITIPEVKVVYVVDYIAGDKNIKKFKVGLHFENLTPSIDDQLGKKINKLLREVDSNKDFENFVK
jgi:hypothetical protein